MKYGVEDIYLADTRVTQDYYLKQHPSDADKSPADSVAPGSEGLGGGDNSPQATSL